MRKPSELSGGEQQRVGVIRALAADPDIILMDEPFSALDPISREKLQEDLIHLQKAIKKTIVFVTHDMNEAMKLADRICLMDHGKIIQLGTPQELIQHPKNKFVENFVGASTNLDSDFHLEEIMSPIQDNRKCPTILVSATLEEVLAQLADQEELLVEKDGNIIGYVNRQMLIGHLSQHVRVGGKANV